MKLIVPIHGLEDVYDKSDLETAEGCYDKEDIYAFALPILACYAQIGLEVWDQVEFYWEDIVDRARRDTVRMEIMQFVENCYDHFMTFEPELIRQFRHHHDVLILGNSAPMADIKKGFVEFEITNLIDQ